MCSVESNFSGVKVLSRRKLKALNLSDKVNIILEVEKSPHIKKKDFAQKYGIPSNTLSTILKNKTVILERYASNINPDCKKVKACAFPEIESALIAWCQTYRSEHGNIPISGILLREKAMELAKSMGAEEFKASSGWLDRFKSRYKTVLRSLKQDKYTTEDSLNDEETLTRILLKYTLNDIFSIEESTFFYSCFQTKERSGSESPSKEERSEDKFTVVVGANASGTEKLPLLVIGRVEIQLSFEDENSLQVEYYRNETDWMSRDLFEHYIRKLDQIFLLKKRKILLFIGNCREYFEVPDLQAIKLETWLGNPSAMLQHSEKGLAKCLENLYKEHLERMTTEGAEKDAHCIDALQAIKILSKKWDKDVSQDIIIDSFKNSSLFLNQQIYCNDKIPSIANEHESLNKCSSSNADDSKVNTSDVYNINIIQPAKTEANESVEDICVLQESPSNAEVTKAISTIECYLRSRSNVNEELLQHLQKISDFVLTQKSNLW